MTTTRHRSSVPTFDALEVALDLIRALRPLMPRLRARSRKLADQLEASASSVAANLAEGNRRRGKDRMHFFRIAAGSADETQAHLRVAEAWGYLAAGEIVAALALTDGDYVCLQFGLSLRFVISQARRTRRR
jgi:four helix bundle protein